MLAISVQADFDLLPNTFLLEIHIFFARTKCLVTVLCEVVFLFRYLALNVCGGERALASCFAYRVNQVLLFLQLLNLLTWLLI